MPAPDFHNFISLAYALSAALIGALAVHGAWRSQSLKRTLRRLESQD